ncbi:MAG: hypothetical protein ABSG78_22980 [Verrucomicrobiota bacterium]|jgi:hypothetical protein
MKFIQLPSGLVINMNQVAYIEPGVDCVVCFSAAVGTQHDARVLHLNLEKADADALLRWLASLGGMIRVS